MRGHENALCCDNPADKTKAVAGFAAAFDSAYDPAWGVSVSSPELGVHTTVTPEGTQVVHLLNYGYEKGTDSVAPLSELTVTAARSVKDVKAYTLTGPLEAELRRTDGKTEIRLKDVPVYAAVELL